LVINCLFKLNDPLNAGFLGENKPYFMIIEKQQNGSILITDIINEQFIKKVYYFTTLTNAKKHFKAYAKQVKQNWFEHLAR
jgi:hypothetical protein